MHHLISLTLILGLLLGLPTSGYSQLIRAAQVDGSIASTGTPLTGNLDIGANQIKNVVDPTLAQDVATKNYVDTVSGQSNTASGNVSVVCGGYLHQGNLS